MRKLKFVGLFIAAGLLMQSAYANCPSAVPPSTKPTGYVACIGMGTSNFNDMYVYTCQSNNTWLKTGGKCSCPNSTGMNNGNLYCMGTYTTSQANANMSYASNGFSTSAQ